MPAGRRLERPGSRLRSRSPAGPAPPLARGGWFQSAWGCPRSVARGSRGQCGCPASSSGCGGGPSSRREAVPASGLGPPPPRVCGRDTRVTRTHQPPEWGPLSLAPSVDKVSGEVSKFPCGTGLEPALRSRPASFHSCPCHVLAVWLRAGPFTSLCLSWLLCKMGRMRSPNSWACEHSASYYA